MSIAMEARLAAAEATLEKLWAAHIELQGHLIQTNGHLLKANERIDELERTAARKPGPKPKDSNA